MGIGFTPRKFDPDGPRKAEARRARKQQEAEVSSAPALSAKEHWQAAAATNVWREGSGPFRGAPDGPEGTAPLYSWVETQHTIVVRAPTRAGLGPADCKLRAGRGSTEVSAGGTRFYV